VNTEEQDQLWQDVMTDLKTSGGDSESDLSPLLFAMLELSTLQYSRSARSGLYHAALVVPSHRIKDTLDSKLKSQICNSIGRLAGAEVNLEIVVKDSRVTIATEAPLADRRIGDPLDPVAEPTEHTDVDGSKDEPNAISNSNDQDPVDEVDLASVADIWPLYTQLSPSQVPMRQTEQVLNLGYLFENFIIGPSNKFAHAAAVAAAEAPAVAYNPLFIWGGSGLGKTHLLHGIGHYTRRLFPGMRVRYVSSEEFTNDFITSLRDNRRTAFQRRYRDVDVLLVDDIQFLEGKEGTQEEFFFTFNALYNANKQIVISSDRPPNRLETLDDRMRTRFEWGLTTDIQPPELETRIAILRKKATMSKPPVAVSDDVIEFIAQKFDRNIRELEGAMTRVRAFATLNHKEVDLASAQEVLRESLNQSEYLDIEASTVIAVTAEYFDVTIAELTGAKKTKRISAARQAAMYLCREMTDLTLPAIGRIFGDRDGPAVMYASKKVAAEVASDRLQKDRIIEIRKLVRKRAYSVRSSG